MVLCLETWARDFILDHEHCRPRSFLTFARLMDFNFRTRPTATAFHCERMTPAGFPQTNLSAVGFHREITLLDGPTVKVPQIRRQSFQQKFPFDLTRNLAVAGLNVTGHTTIFSGPYGPGKRQPQGAVTLRDCRRGMTTYVLQPKIALLRTFLRKLILILIAALSGQPVSIVPAA